MKKKLLCCALLAGMSMTQSVLAQDYDDRFYISAGAGLLFTDGHRNAADELYGTLGFGKFISPNVSLDVELWHSNPVLDRAQFGNGGPERNWELANLSVVGRYHFIRDGRDWNPYLAFGIGAQSHNDGSQRQPLALGISPSRSGSNLAANIGVGIQKDLGWGSLRGEVGGRMDFDDEDRGAGNNDSSYLDGYAGLSFLFPLGAAPAPAAEPIPVVQRTCADLDDDGDGINNCDDKCPGSVAGQAIGPDGCPLPEPEPVMEPKPFRG